MNSSALWAIVGIVVLAGLGFWVYSMQTPAPATDVTVNTETPANTTGTGATSTTGGTGVGVDASADVGIGDASQAPMSASVSYTSSGFSPSPVTIKKGGTVTWTNNGGGNMWVGSAQHPTHTTYSGTTLAEHCDDATDVSFDQCKNGTTYSFTFTKVGTWGYHNHSNAQHFGRVIVVE